LNIEELFDSLQDGAWHSIEEIANKTNIQTNKLVELSKCLSEKGIFLYESKRSRIKIQPQWAKLLPINDQPTQHSNQKQKPTLPSTT
jgi:hypothetical protein